MKDVKVKLHIDETVPPVIQPHRRIPFHLRDKVEAEINKLLVQGIIEKTAGPTPWVSPLIATPKPKNPDEIRLCVDMRASNTAIHRERHITPTVDDIIADLHDAKVFSKLDLNQGYHQLELEEDSRYITTFSSHLGLFRYRRLNFETNSAAEVFQNRLQQVLSDIKGARNISDDVIIFGATQDAHDLALESTLQRFREMNITLNPPKCVFNKSSLDFYGYTFSDGGISPDPKKVTAIVEFAEPANVSELRTFLGMTSYCARFLPHYSTVSAPLRELTKWDWSSQCQEAFASLKEMLTCAHTMSYFNPRHTTEVIADASPFGLGCILAQRESDDNPSKIIAYASRSLTAVERRYCQTEREALALVWSCEHFHLYLYGASFNLITDHKALECIFNNPLSKPPARIERWALRLQDYNFKVVYASGKGNPADYMSRHPIQNDTSSPSKPSRRAEEHVNYITTHAVPTAMTLTEVENATKEDPTLQVVANAIREGKWYKIKDNFSDPNIDKDAIQTYSRIHQELTLTDNNVV